MTVLHPSFPHPSLRYGIGLSSFALLPSSPWSPGLRFAPDGTEGVGRSGITGDQGSDNLNPRFLQFLPTLVLSLPLFVSQLVPSGLSYRRLRNEVSVVSGVTKAGGRETRVGRQEATMIRGMEENDE